MQPVLCEIEVGKPWGRVTREEASPEGAKEYSPWRKPWVSSMQEEFSPERGERNGCTPCRGRCERSGGADSSCPSTCLGSARFSEVRGITALMRW